MKTGKLTPQELTEIVFKHLPPLNKYITCGPGNGLDCAAIKTPNGTQVIMSSDPITGAGKDIGRLAVHVSCNDLAAYGVKPVALMLVLIAPSNSVADEIKGIMDQVAVACNELNTSIAGGHTEISDAVNRYLLTTTAVGFCQGDLIRSDGAKAGDSLIMTKTAGIEGTAILAADFADRLAADMTAEEIDEASALVRDISVVPEGLCGGELQVHAMHDATEGGILGAAWEMAESANLGLHIDRDMIPLHPLTIKICDLLQLNPYRLISSGSMLISTDNPQKLLRKLEEQNIKATCIGKFTKDIRRYDCSGDHINELKQPERDELYKSVQ